MWFLVILNKLFHGVDLTCLVDPGALCSHFTSIMGRIHLDFEWTDGNFLKESIIK